MSTYDNIQLHLKKFMKEKQVENIRTLRYILSQIKYKQIEEKQLQEAPSEKLVLSVLSKLEKQTNESIEIYKQGSNTKLINKEENDLAIIKLFLPKKLTSDELVSIIKQTASEIEGVSMKHMGEIIKKIKSQYAASLDMKMLSMKVKEFLSSI